MYDYTPQGQPRHDIGLDVIEGLAAGYAAHQVVRQHRQRQAWMASLPAPQRANVIARSRRIRLSGVGLLGIGAAMIAAFPHSWFGTAGFVLGFIGLCRVVWGGQ